MADQTELKRYSFFSARAHGWHIDAFWMFLSLVIVLVLWEALVAIFDFPAHLLPRPLAVVNSVIDHWGTIVENAGDTTIAVLLGYVLAVIFAVPIAILIVISPQVERLLYPPLVATQSIPKIALAPLFIVWFGFGLETKVAVTFLICFFPIVVDTIVGLRSIDPSLIQLARSMGAPASRVFLKLRLPGALPSMFGGLKVASALAVVGALTGEYIASDSGLGYILLSASGEMNTALLFGVLIVLSVLAMIFFYAIELLEKLLIPWHVSQRSHAQ
ncbi:MAG: putative aliphatic sulfonates transport permease protein SsuC [Alphaproteobacteria bacterium MarineAlpha11_Bin1]|nr:MAG: putative aliphatic sulfonates transport permease protein SsuC [Alphaproteobacteria bacterium MarineAlpha11_Bin1]|tara:strand:+ start:2017 stop:2835 length:819 start_codon:yes stop_codon:yes gene_type:complete